MRHLAAVLGSAAALGAMGCGGTAASGDQPPAACTLDFCDRVQDLGSASHLIASTPKGIVFTRGIGGEELWHRSLSGGTETRIAAAWVPGSARVDRDGKVLYLPDAAERYGELRGTLHRWDPATGSDEALIDDARVGQYDACGDVAWAFRGDRNDLVANCGYLAVYDGTTGSSTDLVEACDERKLETLAYFSTTCHWLVLAGGVNTADEISVYSVEGRNVRRLADLGNDTFFGDADGFHLIAPVGGSRTRITVQRGALYPLPEGTDNPVPVAMRSSGDLLYIGHEAGAAGLYRVKGFADRSELVTQDVEMVASAFDEANDIFAWIDGAAVENRRLRVTGARDGVVFDLAVPALGFVGPAGGRPHSSYPASIGLSHWIYFTRAGPDGEALLDGWQPVSGTHRRLSSDAVWDVQVDRHADHVAWRELDGLHFFDQDGPGETGRVTDDVFQFRLAGDWLVWVGYDGRLRALPPAD